MGRILTEDQVRRGLERQVKSMGLRYTAKELKVSAAYLSEVLKQTQKIGPKIRKALLLEKNVVVTLEERPIPDSVPRARRLLLEDFRRTCE